MPQHCATMQKSALDAALGTPTDALQKTCAIPAVLTVGMRTDASPGEGAATASPTTHRLGTHAPRPLEDPQRKPPSIDLFSFHVKPAITSIRYEFPCVLSSAVRGRHTEVSMAPRS